MKNYLSLRFMDLFKSLFVLFGLDYSQIRLVVQMKLTEGSRRSRLNFSQLKKKKISKTNNFGIEMILLSVFGLFMGVIICTIAISNPFISFTALFTFNAFFILLTLFSEFYIIYFDLKDSEILLATALKPESLAVGKNIYIFSTFIKYVMAMSIPSLIFYAVYFNPLIIFPILLMLIIILLSLIAIVSMLYAILLKLFSGEKLKDFSTYLQIAVTLIMFLIYQFGIMGLDESTELLELGSTKVSLYYPISWFAGFPSMFLEGYNKLEMLYLTLVSLGVSTTLYIIFAKYLGPYFENNLYKLKINVKKTKSVQRKILFSKFFNKFNFGVFYDLTHKILRSDRKIKTIIYPTMVLSLFLPVMLLYLETKEVEGGLSDTKYYYIAYIFMLFAIQQFVVISQSSYHKASWMFRYLPIRSPGQVYKGAYFGVLMKYQALLLILVYSAILAVWGIVLLPEVLNMVLNLFISILLFRVISDNVLPFSRKFINTKSLSYNGTAYMLVSMVFFPVLGGLHYLFSLFTFGSLILIVMQIVTVILLWKGFSDSISWDDIVE